MLLVGCGRVNFVERDDGSFTGGVIDAPDGALPLVDVAPLDATGLPAGLVVWFPLDEINPQNVHDVVSGFGGSCLGGTCPVMTPGHRNSAFLFDGTDDCLEVADRGQFGQARITLAFWMRQDLVDSCSPVAKPVTLSTTTDSWQIETNGGNQVIFTTTHGSTSNTRITAPTNTLTIGAWRHVAATWDGAMKALYVDGALVGNAPITGALSYDSSSMWIGCDDNGGTFSMRFNGAIDEVQLYNRALTQTEIQMLVAM